LYGKTTTKPFRKMGHVTVVDDDLSLAKKKAITVKDIIKIVS
jgi:5-(carboxyamino)imidazole ribonucleotide synthase